GHHARFRGCRADAARRARFARRALMTVIPFLIACFAFAGFLAFDLGVSLTAANSRTIVLGPRGFTPIAIALGRPPSLPLARAALALAVLRALPPRAPS